MRIRLIVFVALVFAMAATYGQDITLPQADSLRLGLNKPLADTSRLEILFRLAEFYIVKPGEARQDLDNAAAYLKKAELINAKLQSEDVRGFHAMFASLLAKKEKQEKRGKELAEKAVHTLSGSSNKFYLARAYFCLADYYHYSDRTELVEKIRLMELSTQCYAQTKYIESYAYALKHLADLYEINEQRAKVLENLNLSLKLYKSIHYPMLYGVYVLYTRYYFLGGNYKLALDYGLMALKDADAAGDSTMSYCQINNYLAITQVHLKERERATGYYKIALRIAEKYNENASVMMLMNNMVLNYIELKKPLEALKLIKGIPANLLVPVSEEGHVMIAFCYASIYFDLKKYQETGFYCNQILGLIKANKPRAQVLNDFYSLLIRFYVETKQYASAQAYLQVIDSLSRKTGDPARIKDNYYLAFRLDTAMGRYKPAIANLLQFQHLRDSLFDEKNTRQMQELEVEYETQKSKNEISIRDKDIALLNQKNQLQQNRLHSAGMARNYTIAGIGLLLVIIVLLYYQYRHKQKNNKVISGKNELLQRLLIEKEWLLKEVHHRVKNNLQIVMSLLNSQSAYMENDAALAAINDSQHRVHAMSLIHQKLYNSENFSSVDMPAYIRELVSYLRDSFNTGQRIHLEFTIQPLELDISQAVPLGLILNEAITNAIKYAFPNGRDGVITISLSQTSLSHYLLSISDNGIGIPSHYTTKKPGSLGMSLMAGLSEDIDGKLAVENNKGTTIKISFIPDGGSRQASPAAVSLVSNN